MKNISRIILCTLFLLFSFSTHANSALENSPLGYWKTIDDVSGKPKSILRIAENKDGSLFGQIVKVFPQPGQIQKELCTDCQGPRHNQRIVGMVIMEGLKRSAENTSKWINGTILDPSTGETYHCSIQAMNAEKLTVRGYIGVPMFGRSQTWLRAKSPQG